MREYLDLMYSRKNKGCSEERSNQFYFRWLQYGRKRRTEIRSPYFQKDHRESSIITYPTFERELAQRTFKEDDLDFLVSVVVDEQNKVFIHDFSLYGAQPSRPIMLLGLLEQLFFLLDVQGCGSLAFDGNLFFFILKKSFISTTHVNNAFKPLIDS